MKYIRIWEIYVNDIWYMTTWSATERDNTADELAADYGRQNVSVKERRKKHTGRRCCRCHAPVFVSDVRGYSFQCYYCDEDLVTFETYEE